MSENNIPKDSSNGRGRKGVVAPFGGRRPKIESSSVVDRMNPFGVTVSFVLVAMFLFGFFFDKYFVHVDENFNKISLTHAGQVIGLSISNDVNGYSTFGNGEAGVIRLYDNSGTQVIPYSTSLQVDGKIIFSPMSGASNFSYNQADISSIYGPVYIKGKAGNGPGVIPYSMNLLEGVGYNSRGDISLASGNYGTQASRNDKSWCFVLKMNKTTMKFTSKATSYIISYKTPLTCLNGK